MEYLVTMTTHVPDGTPGVLTLDDGREPRGDRLLVATGRRPRLPDGLDTVGITAGPHGIPVDSRMRAGERLWALGGALRGGAPGRLHRPAGGVGRRA